MALRSLCVIGVALDEKRLVCTVIVSVPKALNRFSTARVEPPPIEVSATTAATPITMPRIVRKARSGLARRLENARRSDSRKTVTGRPRPARRRHPEIRRRSGSRRHRGEPAAALQQPAARALGGVRAGAVCAVGVLAGDHRLTRRQAAGDLRVRRGRHAGLDLPEDRLTVLHDAHERGAGAA